MVLPFYPDIYISGCLFVFSLLLEDFKFCKPRENHDLLETISGASLTAENTITLSWNLILTGPAHMSLLLKRKIKVHTFHDRLWAT